MHCHEFERRLHRLLDERRWPEEDRLLQAHALTCHPCQQLLEAQSQLLEGLSLNPAPEPSVHFTDQVLVQLEPPVQRSLQVSLAASALAACAACLLLIALVPRDPNRAEVAVTVGQTSARPDVDPVGNQLEQPLAQARANPASDADVPVITDHPRSRVQLSQWWQHLPPPPEEVGHSVDQLTTGLRPLANSFTVAIDALRDTLPVVRQPATPEPPA